MFAEVLRYWLAQDGEGGNTDAHDSVSLRVSFDEEHRRMQGGVAVQAGIMSTAVTPVAEARHAFGRSERISTLDGWRGVAILLVLAQHSAQYSRFVHQPWANLGTFGVYIFFVLSGYIITMRLVEEREKSSSISLSHFYLRRAFRILPPVFAWHLITVYLLSRFFNLGGFRSSEITGLSFLSQLSIRGASRRDVHGTFLVAIYRGALLSCMADAIAVAAQPTSSLVRCNCRYGM